MGENLRPIVEPGQSGRDYPYEAILAENIIRQDLSRPGLNKVHQAENMPAHRMDPLSMPAGKI